MTAISLFKKIFSLFTILLFCSSEKIHAGQSNMIDWPFATSVSSIIGDAFPHYEQYKVSWVNVPVEATVSDDIIATKCASGCYVYEILKTWLAGYNMWAVGDNYASTSLGVVTTWAELSAQLKKTKYGSSGAYIQNRIIDGKVNGCAGLMIAPKNAITKQVPWDTIVTRSLDPQGHNIQCIPAPPGNDWCALANPELNFNHGVKVISDYKLNGSTVTEQVQVECTNAVKFTLKLVNGSSGVHLSNGLTANLQVEGKPLGTSLNGESGIHTLNISSALTGDKPVAGNFNGTSILMVSYP